jgi:hypothetical protein
VNAGFAVGHGRSRDHPRCQWTRIISVNKWVLRGGSLWLRWAVDEGISQRIGAAIPAPEPWVVVATGVFAVLVTVSSLVVMSRSRPSLLWAGYALSTIIHETGHALTAIATGGSVEKIQITGPGEGSVVPGKKFWPSNVISAAAGYAMPPLAGVGAAWLLNRGHAPAVLAITTAVMAVLLFVGDDITTRLFVLAVGLLPFVALLWGTSALQNFVAYSEAWLLLTNEAGGLLHLIAARKVTPAHNDADLLARKTWIPGSVWIVGWATVIIWGLWTGVPLLFSAR